MLLAADIGNTNITFGLFRGRRLVRTWRARTEPRPSVEMLSRALKRAGGKKAVDAIIYGSVVPSLNIRFERVCRRLWSISPRAVTPNTSLGIRLRVDRPSEVGADRLLNALAAHRLYKRSAIIVDFGTATTFDCLSFRGDYLGGAIVPGPDMAARALSFYTAQLPRVSMGPTRRVIGRNTIECIRAGLYHGYVGMIRHVLKRSVAQLRSQSRGKPVLIATGGLAKMFIQEIGCIDKVEPDLTLKGLYYAYETIC